jgi:hypothetical protein
MGGCDGAGQVEAFRVTEPPALVQGPERGGAVEDHIVAREQAGDQSLLASGRLRPPLDVCEVRDCGVPDPVGLAAKACQVATTGPGGASTSPVGRGQDAIDLALHRSPLGVVPPQPSSYLNGRQQQRAVERGMVSDQFGGGDRAGPDRSHGRAVPPAAVRASPPGVEKREHHLARALIAEDQRFDGARGQWLTPVLGHQQTDVEAVRSVQDPQGMANALMASQE